LKATGFFTIHESISCSKQALQRQLQQRQRHLHFELVLMVLQFSLVVLL